MLRWGNGITGRTGNNPLNLQHLSKEADKVSFRGKLHCGSQCDIYSLMAENGGNLHLYFTLQLLTWYFKQHILLRGIFPLLKKTFIKPRPNQNSNLKIGNRNDN